MSEISWIKINTDIFDHHKIKLIEKLPEGDTMLVIWLKLLTMAGRRNDSGMVYITRDIPFTPETLSDVMSRDSKIVMLALNTFVSFDMIEIEKNFIKIIGWDEHQNVEGMDKIKEQNRIRQAKYRQRKQLEFNDEIKKSNVTSRDSNAIDKNRIDKNRIEDKFIFLTKKIKVKPEDHEKLLEEIGKERLQYLVDNMQDYLENPNSKRSSYKCYYRALLDWNKRQDWSKHKTGHKKTIAEMEAEYKDIWNDE